jgi:hypothetical protein
MSFSFAEPELYPWGVYRNTPPMYLRTVTQERLPAGSRDGPVAAGVLSTAALGCLAYALLLHGQERPVERPG